MRRRPARPRPARATDRPAGRLWRGRRRPRPRARSSAGARPAPVPGRRSGDRGGRWRPPAIASAAADAPAAPARAGSRRPPSPRGSRRSPRGARGRRRAGGEPGAAAPGRSGRADEPSRSATTTWSRNAPQVAAASSRSSRMPMPASASPPTSASTKPSTASRSTRPSRSRTRVAVSASAPDDRSWSSIDSASRMPPAARRATSAIASASAARPSASRMRPRACPRSGPIVSGRKSNRWTRDRTAGRILAGSVVQKMNATWSGGSSSVLRRTSQPSLMRWTSSMMKTLRRRSDGAV